MIDPVRAGAGVAAPRVAQISFFLDPLQREPALLLQQWPSLVDIADAAHGARIALTVIQASTHRQTLHHHGVDYHFLPPPASGRLAQAPAFMQLLRSLAPEVLHVHGLGFPADVLSLAANAQRRPILLQDHAGRLPRLWRRRLWRRGFAAAAAVSFCAQAQAEPFRRMRLFGQGLRVYEIPESTSRFTPGDPVAARAATGLRGDPCVLSVGHLVPNKDPLTVLAGFRAAVSQLADPHLWCYFGSAPLLPAVRECIERDSLLRDRVHLMGRVPHAHIEQAMRAADLFVSGSHNEGSGYALIEALACGLPPVVSDIPSFRALTGEGSVGALWSRGDARALTAALLAVSQRPKAPARDAARMWFERELSFAALGRKLRHCYEELLMPAARGRLVT